MTWKKEEQPKTVEESYKNLINLTIRNNRARAEELDWSPEDIENVFGKKENIYDFLWQESSKNNPYYIKILEKDTMGKSGDINRPYYERVDGAADTMGVFLHNLLPDFDAEATHAFQKSILGSEDFKKAQREKMDLISELVKIGPKTFAQAKEEIYDIPFSQGYNIENLAHGFRGEGVKASSRHGGLEQIINDLTSTTAVEPFGENEKKNFIDSMTNLIENLR